jgi:putative endonuclease
MAMANPIQQLGRWIKSSGLVFWKHRLVNDLDGRDPRHSLGSRGERVAANFLKHLGYRILAQGHRKKLGEIDIIAVDGQCVVFVEVKTWRSDADVDPSAAVNHIKQDKITRTALAYLKRHQLLNQPARFDVIAVVWDGSQATQPKIRHYKHAFEARGHGQLFR